MTFVLCMARCMKSSKRTRIAFNAFAASCTALGTRFRHTPGQNLARFPRRGSCHLLDHDGDVFWLTLIFRRFFGFGPFFYHSGLGHFNELRHGLLPILVAARTPRVRSFDPHIDALAPFFSRLLCLSIINIALRVFMGLVFLQLQKSRFAPFHSPTPKTSEPPPRSYPVSTCSPWQRCSNPRSRKSSFSLPYWILSFQQAPCGLPCFLTQLSRSS